MSIPKFKVRLIKVIEEEVEAGSMANAISTLEQKHDAKAEHAERVEE